ncbi:MAG: hypothetical protein E7417_01670 [Ruminococcaceae bacterium]|nr:hypothetical protein [Oscillospiraceae bacterium]
MKKNTEHQTSLSTYTALIFLVALVMIVVSFFAQTHLEQAMVSEHEQEKVNLSNKAAQVSEENLQLVELNKTLRMRNTELETTNEAMTAEKNALAKEITSYEALIAVYDALYEGKFDIAKEMLLGIYTEDLSPTQKDLYDSLAKKLQ